MSGVVSLPHGWGHGTPGSRMLVAAEHAGVSDIRLTLNNEIEPLSGNAILCGVPVTVEPVAVAVSPARVAASD